MRRRQQHLLHSGWRNGQFNFYWRRKWRRFAANRRNLIILLLFIALVPPLFFHFRLGRFHQIQMKNCGWIRNPPLVCAHGGDSTNAFPNTIAAYRSALHSQADCIEIDVSRSADGILFALHDRELQRISRNHTSKVGYFNTKEIEGRQGTLYVHTVPVNQNDEQVLSDAPFLVSMEISELDAALHFPKVLDDQRVPTLENALRLVSDSVRQVILDAKVGPPLYEKGLAENILAVVKRTHCTNCIIWAKSDTLVREIIRLAPNTTVGYIVLKDPKTGFRSNLLRMKKAGIVGVYHALVDEKLVQMLHGRNKKIYAWTVDDMVSMQDMLVNRVDAVVTSNPAVLQQLMQETRTRCLEEGFSLL